MKTNNAASISRRRRLAFTLIELLVVIAIMAILAALIFPVTGMVNASKIRNKTKAEMGQIQFAIEAYKTKHGVYPPDNPNDLNVNPLYYELTGTTLASGTYTTLDNASTIATNTLAAAFSGGVTGFINSRVGAGSDEGINVQNFAKTIKPTQIAEIPAFGNCKVLVGSVGWPANRPTPPFTPPPGSSVAPNPWHYVSRNPTNNPRSFDLWIDVIVGSKTNRICNWNEKQIVL